MSKAHPDDFIPTVIYEEDGWNETCHETHYFPIEKVGEMLLHFYDAASAYGAWPSGPGRQELVRDWLKQAENWIKGEPYGRRKKSENKQNESAGLVSDKSST